MTNFTPYNELQRFYVDIHAKRYLFQREDHLFELFGLNPEGDILFLGLYRSWEGEEDSADISDLDISLCFYMAHKQCYLLTKVIK